MLKPLCGPSPLADVPVSKPGSVVNLGAQDYQPAFTGVSGRMQTQVLEPVVLTVEPHWLKRECVVDFPLCFLVFSRFSTVDISLIFIKKKGWGTEKKKDFSFLSL